MQTASTSNSIVTFLRREFRGSRFRCLLATSQPKPMFLEWMNSLLRPFGEIERDDVYMPRGFECPEEAKLGETERFLSQSQREAVNSWWLASRSNANTPNWDFVSTCTVAGKRGLVLLEAKAHAGELHVDDCCGAGGENRKRIAGAIEEASRGLGNGWHLSSERCYQLNNRFAWAWKIASLGVPVILVYLGFLGAVEMRDSLDTRTAWENCLHAYADSHVPRSAWDSERTVNGTPLIALIRSTNVNISAT